MRVLIVDDEALARQRLKRLLNNISDLEIIGDAVDGIQAVEMIESERPDLVLLDIQMPRLDGFGVVEALDVPPTVIFVTAYDEYAIRAFEVNALDYLLKPFSRERLEQAIQRAREAQVDEQDFSERLVPLLKSLRDQGKYITRLAVRTPTSIKVLAVEMVDRIGIVNEETLVHVGEESYPVRRTLKDLEGRLDPTRFFRANRSEIVNLDRVAEIIPWFKGSHKIRLRTGDEVDLSRSKARVLREILDW